MEKYQNEKQFQASVVRWFGETYPQFRGLLFEINNDTYSQRHAASRMATGMVGGVADLCFISPSGRGVFFFELKLKGTRHSIDHLERQLEWGLAVTKAGCEYAVIDDTMEKDLKMFINELCNPERRRSGIVDPIMAKINESKKKNVKTIKI